MTDQQFKWILTGIGLVTVAGAIISIHENRTPEPKPVPTMTNQIPAGADMNAVLAMMRREGFSNFVMHVTKQGFQFEIGLGDEASKVFYVKPLE